jgi:hypothetical protein
MGGVLPRPQRGEIIDLGAPTPTWQFGPNMSGGRIEMDAVILPNGKVLAMGGSSSDENESTAAFTADLFDLMGPPFPRPVLIPSRVSTIQWHCSCQMRPSG